MHHAGPTSRAGVVHKPKTAAPTSIPIPTAPPVSTTPATTITPAIRGAAPPRRPTAIAPAPAPALRSFRRRVGLCVRVGLPAFSQGGFPRQLDAVLVVDRDGLDEHRVPHAA